MYVQELLAELRWLLPLSENQRRELFPLWLFQENVWSTMSKWMGE